MIVLDTHAWLWWVVAPKRLSHDAAALIEGADQIGVPTVCCLELVALDRRKRIELDRPIHGWIEQSLAHEAVQSLPLTSEIAIEAGRLPNSFPGDPADRIVYATASVVGAPLVTRDRRIRDHDPVRAVW